MSSGSELSFGWVEADDEEELILDDIDNIVPADTNTNDMPADMNTNNVVVKAEPIDDSYIDENIPEDVSVRNSVTNSVSRHRSSVQSSLINNSVNTTDYTIDDFLKDNPKLMNVVSTNDNVIDTDDEVWLIQCPHNFDADSITEVPLNNDKSKIRIPGTNYEWLTLEKDKDERITTLIPSTKHKGCVLNTIPVKGKIIIKERIKTSNAIQIPEVIESNFPFPTNLKTRHPLFGIDYEKQIEVSQEIQAKLKEPPKKIRKSKCNAMEVDSSVTKDKSSKKKRKADTLEDEIINPSKKIKKEKSNWENETSIEMNLFEFTKKKIKKEKS